MMAGPYVVFVTIYQRFKLGDSRRGAGSFILFLAVALPVL
jgi:hypothetical protein